VQLFSTAYSAMTSRSSPNSVSQASAAPPQRVHALARPLSVLALILACSSCVTTTHRLRYRVPLTSSQAERCVASCPHAGSSTPEYADCLARCPGVETRRGVDCGEQDRPPVAACIALDRQEREVHQAIVIAGVLAGIAAVVLVVGALTINSTKDDTPAVR
jgi:hypothetical protein